METKLIRIAELAKERPDLKFTSLAHLLNEENLTRCHHALPSGKATGVLRTTKEEYGENLAENISDLVGRMKRRSYRPVPVRRAYIAKPGTDKKRPLGIPEHEDKIVQRGMAKILNAIYEPLFLDCSFGFRPNRNCHDALKILNVYIEKRYTNFIVDVDIKGFFDNVDHEWITKTALVRLHINDNSLKICVPATGEIIAEHTISQEKGRLIKNRNHSRDRSKSLDLLRQELITLLAHEKATHYLERISVDYRRYRRDQYTLIKKVAQENTEWIHLALEKCIDENLYSANAFRDVIEFLRRTEPDKPSKTEEDIKPSVDIAVHTRDLNQYLQLMGGKYDE